MGGRGAHILMWNLNLGLTVPGTCCILCKCGKVDVAETGHNIEMWFTAHVQHVCLFQINKSVVAEHSTRSGHCMNFILKTTEYKDHLVKEDTEISLEHCFKWRPRELMLADILDFSQEKQHQLWLRQNGWQHDFTHCSPVGLLFDKETRLQANMDRPARACTHTYGWSPENISSHTFTVKASKLMLFYVM